MIARIVPFLVPGAIAAFYAFAACAPVQNDRIGVEAPPYSDSSFQPVADYLENRCGTLDCHGAPGRNLRMWGCEGLRLDPSSSPATCASPTTEAEYQATYRSLVALEPQVMTTVYSGCSAAIADGGAEYPVSDSCHPELLTFIRKARGIETHKGGKLICLEPPCPDGVPDPVPLDGDAGPDVDPQDVCLVSWLEGATDKHMCGMALAIPSFPLLEAGTP
ncbi:MAG: hypothetical protein ACRELB_26040 [Polyangiaceae bacterium]